jgi:2-iminobutanoate/2-iminopropanoate deaminase
MPLNPADGSLIPGGVGEQTLQTMRNLKNVLEAAGSSLEKILQITVYLTDLNAFDEMNEAYGSFFKDEFPARVTVGVSALAKNAKVEMQAVALVD